MDGLVILADLPGVFGLHGARDVVTFSMCSWRFFTRLAGVAFLTIVGCTAPPALLETPETPQDRAVRKQEEHAVSDRLGRMGEDFSTFQGRKVDWE